MASKKQCASAPVRRMPMRCKCGVREIRMKLLSFALASRTYGAGALALAALTTLPAFAQEAAGETGETVATAAALSGETAFVFNTLLFLLGGFLVMWMAAGFAMLEAGMVRAKNVSMQLLKNISLYSIAGIMYWAVGYSLMYVDVNGFFGSFSPYSWPEAGMVNEGDYAVASDWFFQMVFVATAASIVSGTLAERIKLW